MRVLRRTGRKLVAPVMLMVIIVFAMSIFAGATEINMPKGQPFAGVTVRHGDQPRPLSEALRPIAREFEKETGIKVIVDLLDESALVQKFLLESIAGTAYFDLIYNSPRAHEDYIKGGFVKPLNDYVEKYGFTWDDYPMTTVTEMCTYPGMDEILGLPFLTTANLFYYRKDLLEDPKEMADFKATYGYGLRVPTNPTEWYDVAEFFTRPEEDLYGDGQPAGPGRIWDQLFWVLMSHNESGWYPFNEQTWEVQYDTPATVDGWIWLKKLFQNTMPPDIQGWGFAQQMPHFKQGRLAMTRYWVDYAMDLVNPETTPIAADVGVAKPFGKNNLGGGSLSVSAMSENPEAAFLWGLYLQKKDVQREWFYNGGVLARKSLFADPEIIAKRPLWAKVGPMFVWALENASKSRPRIMEFSQIQKSQYMTFIDYLNNSAPWEDRSVAQKYVTQMHGEIQVIFIESGRLRPPKKN